MTEPLDVERIDLSPTPTVFSERGPMRYDRRVLALALLACLPAVVTALVLVWSGDFSPKVRWTLSTFLVGSAVGFSLALQARVVRPLQTLSNLISALREGDYTLRARGARRDDPLGEVIYEVNALGQTLREQRLGALEATHLLHTVMDEIDVAVFAFDGSRRLKLVNRAGERLLGRSQEQLLGANAESVGLSESLEGQDFQTRQLEFPGGTGRWGIHRSVFWEQGLPHQLLVLTELSRALREEERQAWQRLIRVMGHELGNSLAPIKSIAGSLKGIVSRNPLLEDWREDVTRGLSVIESRSEALGRFMTAYGRLARLPPPRLEPVDLAALVHRVAGLETRLPVMVTPGPETRPRADRDQLEQALINLVRNAVDAALETGGGVRIRWERGLGQVILVVEDDGPGLSNTANLFVPFFTTRPGGSGIGLVLSRQIAEGHGGSLTLRNRESARGCEARLALPV